MRLITFLKIVVALLVVVIVAAGGLLLRLAAGPISLVPVAGVIERLVSRAGPFQVELHDPALAWSREQGTILLQARDLRVRDHAGGFIASAPSVGLRLDVDALLRHRLLALREAELALPSLQLVRQADRRLVLHFGGNMGALPLDQATGGGVLGNLAGGAPEAADPETQRLRRIRVSAQSLQFTDEITGRSVEAGRARLRLTHEPRGWELQLDLDVPGGGSLRLAVAPGAGTAQAIGLDIHGLHPAVLAGLVPEVDLGGVEPALSGRIAFALDPATLTPGPGHFSLRGDAGVVALPGILAEPLPIEGFALEGEGKAGWEEVKLGALALSLPQARLQATGSLRRREGRLDTELAITGHGIDPATLTALWSPRLGSQARLWVAGNLRAGLLPDASLKLGLPLGPDAGRPEVTLDFTFTDAALRFLPEWPLAEGASGSGHLTRDALTLKLAGAKLGDLVGHDGTVNLSGFGVPGPVRLDLAFSAESAVGTALDLLDRPPLRLASAIGLKPGTARGSASAQVQLGLPLKDKLAPEEVAKRVQATLKGLGYPGLRPGFDLTDGALEVTVDDAAAVLQGEVAINAVPLRMEWRERLAGRGETRRITLAGDLDRARLKALGATLPPNLDGGLSGTATVIDARGAPRRIDLDADLARLAFWVPELAAEKRGGQPGRLVARLEQAGETALRVLSSSVTAPGLLFRGSLDLALKPFAWQRVGIDELTTPATSLKGELARQGAGLVVRLDAERLDLRPWRAQASRSGSGGPGDLDLGLRARSLQLGLEPLQDVDLTALNRGGRWQQARLGGTLPGGARLSAALDAARLPGSFQAEADDLAPLPAVLGFERPKLEGGRGRVEGQIQDAPGGPVWTGEAKLREFLLRDAPAVAQILSIASFQGIGNAFAGRGLGVDKVTVPFTWQGQRIELHQARLVGSELGARVDGTVDLGNRTLELNGSAAPLYTINRLIGRIPLLGNLLRGEKADAALAATFTVAGGFDAPQISVNPLAALVPGFIRDLFGSAERVTEPEPRD